MSEMHIKPRQILVLIIIFLIILLVVHRNGKQQCGGITNPHSLYAEGKGASLPKIYAITPTYARPEQKAELTRLSHLVMLVPNVVWVIVEDSDSTSTLVAKILKRAGLENRSMHLSQITPKTYKLKNDDPNWVKPRGVAQRNHALNTLSYQISDSDHSIVYFMDDDNAYSIELFEEISKIKPGHVGIWPVGLVGGLMVEKPLLNADNTKVIGFNAAWRPERPFPIDMAAFAISTDLFFKNPQARFAYEEKRGYQESQILSKLTTVDELQPLANKCLDVLVWHVRTEKTKLTEEEKLRKQGKRSDEGMEV